MMMDFPTAAKLDGRGYVQRICRVSGVSYATLQKLKNGGHLKDRDTVDKIVAADPRLDRDALLWSEPQAPTGTEG